MQTRSGANSQATRKCEKQDNPPPVKIGPLEEDETQCYISPPPNQCEKSPKEPRAQVKIKANTQVNIRMIINVNILK